MRKSFLYVLRQGNSAKAKPPKEPQHQAFIHRGLRKRVKAGVIHYRKKSSIRRP
ncbi:MAG: hypothetical protein JWO84_422 [Parcubacteria group bacterium]|nr:hypothetical protein [Parcubacteria group bacterium]